MATMDAEDLLAKSIEDLVKLKTKREILDSKYQLFLDKKKLDLTYRLKSSWKSQIFTLKAKFLDNLMLIESILCADLQCTIFMKNVISNPSAISINELKLENEHILQEIKSIKEQNNPIVESTNETVELRKLKECSKDLQYIPMPELETIIRDISTQENKMLMEYVNNFKENNTDELPRDAILRVKEFILMNRADLVERCGILDTSKIELCLENFIFPFIHTKIMDDICMKDQDQNLEERCKEFASATQEEYNINPKLIDHSYVPYYPAISLLRTVNFSLTPSRKLYTIIQAAKEVFTITGRLLPGESIGGDDFTDIWVYVVAKACIPNLWSIINFLSEYGNEELLQAELGYYFTTTHLAASYLSKLTSGKLKSSKKSQISSGPFIVFEKAKYERFCNQFGHISVVQPNIELSGYRLFIHTELFEKPGRFFCTFLCKSNNMNDKVIGHVLQAKPSMNPVQLEFLFATFFQDHPQFEFISTTIKEGTTYLYKKRAIKGAHYHVKSGDFDEELEQTKTVINFRKMKYNVVTNSSPFLDYEDIEKVYLSFSIDLDRDVVTAVTSLVKRVQRALIHLHFLHKICEVDGFISELVTKAIKKFQEFYNTSTRQNLSEDESLDINRFLRDGDNNERPTIIESNGVLTPTTYKCIFLLLGDCLNGLSEVFQPFTGDPIEDHEELSNTIGELQKKNGFIPTFVFDQKTISLMISKLVNKQIV